MEGTYYPTKPTSLPPPHPSAPSPSSPRSLEETLLVILFVCNIVMISSLFPLHHHHHHSSSSWDLNLMGMDCFDSLQVDLKKAFHEVWRGKKEKEEDQKTFFNIFFFKQKKLPGIGSYPVRLAEATGGRLVTSVLPSNIFLSADTLFVYDVWFPLLFFFFSFFVFFPLFLFFSFLFFSFLFFFLFFFFLSFFFLFLFFLFFFFSFFLFLSFFL